MNNIEIDQQAWAQHYVDGFNRYMQKYHSKLYEKFCTNIHPPLHVGDGIVITEAKVHSDEDYMEIMAIAKDFCSKYPAPGDFPKEF